MGREKNAPQPRGPWRNRPRNGTAGKVLAGLSLVSVGICLGIVVGSLVDGPRLFVRRLTHPVQRVELSAPASEMPSGRLHAFRKLQLERAGSSASTAGPSAPTRLPVADSRSRMTRPQRSEGGRPMAAQGSPEVPGPSHAVAPASVSAAPRPLPDTPEQHAVDRVIAAIRAERRVGVGAPTGAKVIQVAAYRDRRAAGALARRLEKRGFDCYVSHAEVKGVDRYRVRVRPEREAVIGTLTTRLRDQGLRVWVTTE